MKRLVLNSIVAASIMAGITACGPKPRTERIGGSSSSRRADASKSGSQLTKAQESKIKELFSVAAITKLQMEISSNDNGLLSNPVAVEKVATKYFKDLITLSVGNSGNTKNKDTDATDSQKPQNNVWEDLKVIEVQAVESQGVFEGLILRLGLLNEEIELNGSFHAKNSANANWDDGRTALLTDKTNIESKVEALSSCMADDCSVILSVIKLDEINFKVIVSSKNNVKKLSMSGSQSKNIISGSVDIHRVVGTNQEQIIFNLNYDQANSKMDKLYSRAVIQNAMNLTEEIFYVNSPLGDTTKVSVSSDGGKLRARIFNNPATNNDDLYLEIIGN